jgi:translation initiation factor 3 subunit H
MQVVMKIVKHCKEAAPSLVTGQLLGLDIGATLEAGAYTHSLFSST